MKDESGGRTEGEPVLREASALETLNSVADSVHRSLDPVEVARAAVDAIRAYKPFSAVSILALSDDGRQLVNLAAKGFSRDTVRDRLPVEGSLCGLAIESREVCATEDLAVDSRGLAEQRALLARDGFRGVVCVPLIHLDRPLGVMNLALLGDERVTDEEQETLLAVSKTIALAMDNARHVQQLREKDLRYAMATAAAQVGVWDWNLESGAFYLDPNVKALLGYTDDEMPNDLDAWSERIHPEDRDRVESAIRSHLEGRTPEFGCEHRMLHKDGSVRWIMARGNGMRDESGKIVRVVGTDADITGAKRIETERRELEQQMLHAEKLKSLGVLAGGISHEFNNLLTAILGNAGLAHRDAPLGSALQRRIEQIEAASQRATDLTRQLLAYSGRGAFVVRPVDVGELIHEMVDLLRVSISKKARLECNCSPGLPFVHGDPGQLRQLVVNLVTNASEALGGDSGTVVVRTGVVDAGSDLRVKIEVTDNGCGIDPKQHGRILEPFYTTKFTGRGLGLAAVHGIVRGHQGVLEVDSELGRGSTFRVILPASDRADVRDAGDGIDESDDPAGAIVLVVDDEPAVCTLARTILTEAGYEVLTAANGVEALSVFGERAGEIDLVLLDLSMPALNGLETLRAIRTIRSDARVVLTSGYGPSDALAEIEGDTLAGFLGKPYDPERLLREIRRALKR